MRRSVSVILGLVVVLLVAAPAGAINVPGCGEFVLFAKTGITFEQGNTILTGNVFAQGANGFVKVGAHNIIHGTVSANRIVVGHDAVVDDCVANVIELLGSGKCLTSSIGFTPPAACTASFPPPPLTVPTFPGICSPGTQVNVPADTSATLAPGCYDRIRVNRGATLTLTPGAQYFVRGEFRQLGGDKPGDGSTVIGGNGRPDAPAIINVAGQYYTESGVFLTNLLINSTNTGQAVHIFNNSLVRDVVVSSLGGVHPHTGVQLRGDTELVAVTFDVQPITNEGGAPNLQACVCRPGSHFLLDTPTNPNDRACVPD